MIKRVFKWTVALVIVAEWYTRSGRYFIFGERPVTFGVGETVRTWVDLPPGDLPTTISVNGTHKTFASPIEIEAEGHVIGHITKVRPKYDATDFAGYPTEQYEVFTEIARPALGYPINVALAEATDLVHKTLGIG